MEGNLGSPRCDNLELPSFAASMRASVRKHFSRLHRPFLLSSTMKSSLIGPRSASSHYRPRYRQSRPAVPCA